VVIDIEKIAAAAKGFDSKLENLSDAKIRSDVRLRTRGSNSAKSIGVVPRGERVRVVGCRAWCEVLYKGNRGWVYSGYVEGHEGKRVRKKVTAHASSAKASGQGVAPKGSWVRRLFGGGVASENRAQPPKD
jgi:uncharacterized protein YraI